jgi:hypothetical protein
LFKILFYKEKKNEEDFSAVKTEKKKYARIQNKNGYKRGKESAFCQEKKRAETVDCFGIKQACAVLGRKNIFGKKEDKSI